MPPNVSGTSPRLEKYCTKDEAHLECPKELQARITEEKKQLDKIQGHEQFSKIKKWYEFETDLIWLNIVAITLFHVAAVFALFTFPIIQHPKSVLWVVFVGQMGGFGVTGGAHRMWTHRAYKAKLPLRILLLICFHTSGENPLYDWVRDHRVHHKFSETDADPHNSNRGFFFAHVGWLMMRKHPEVIRKGREVDLSDILADPVVQFGTKYFLPLKIAFAFVLPTVIPVYLWNESWYYAITSQCLIRYAFVLNSTWSVNSAAHIWGQKPYDKNIAPVENKAVAFMALGEGWHNYHHVFPWDYKAAELGNYRMNTTTALIDFFARIGWAYDLRQPSKELVKTVMHNRGDNSHHLNEVPVPESKLD